MTKPTFTLRSIDKPLFNIWQALYCAFYSAKLYVDVAKRWRGIGCKYTLLLIAVIIIPLATRVVVDFNDYFDENVLFPIRSMPVVHIRGGEAVFDKPMPYLINNKDHEAVVVVDTTGKLTNIKHYPHAIIVVTKDKFYYRLPKLHLFFSPPDDKIKSKLQVESFADYADDVFMGPKWMAGSNLITLKWICCGMTYPCLFMFTFSIFFVHWMILSTVGQIVARWVFKFKLDFKTASRLIAVASTAHLTVLFGLLATNFHLQGIGLLSVVFVAVYFSYAVLCVKNASHKLVFA